LLLLLQGDGSSITVEPGLILGEVNRLLAAYAKKNKLPIQYKMGPDPRWVGGGAWFMV
jgi:D-lactate dehydrogenase